MVAKAEFDPVKDGWTHDDSAVCWKKLYHSEYPIRASATPMGSIGYASSAMRRFWRWHRQATENAEADYSTIAGHGADNAIKRYFVTESEKGRGYSPPLQPQSHTWSSLALRAAG